MTSKIELQSLSLFILLLYTLLQNIVIVDSVLTIDPPSANKPINERFVFSCDVKAGSGSGTDKLRWIDPNNNEIAPNDDRRQVINFDRSLKLQFNPLSESDAGTYTCASQYNGQATATLSIYEKITWSDCKPTQAARMNEEGIIRCVSSGSPSPQVSWSYQKTKDSPKIDISMGNRYWINNRQLTIKAITAEDKGFYTCRAEVKSRGDIEVRVIEFEIYSSPKMTSKPVLLNTPVQGKGVSIECIASGYPLPEYFLFRAGLFDDALKNTAKYTQIESTGQFTIWDLKPEDSGDYICEARNEVGQERSSVYVKVIVPPINMVYENRRVEIGKTIRLHCEVYADPPAMITFHKIYNLNPFVTGIQPTDSRIELKNGNLIIHKTTRLDTGNYTCIATNDGGFLKLNKTLIIEHPPEFVGDLHKRIYHWPSHVKNISCEAYAEPRPAFQWWHFRDRIIPRDGNDTFKIFDNVNYTISVLQIKITPGMETWIFGAYKCSVSNKLVGRTYVKDYDFTLMQAHPPKNPSSIKILKHTSTSIRLQASPPEDDGGVPVKGYQMTYQSGTNGFWNQPRSFGLNESLYVKNLLPDTYYRVLLMAINDVGASPGETSQIKTLSMREPDKVVITSDPVSTDPYSYVLSWKKPQNGGVPISAYRIQYRKIDVDENGKLTTALGKWITYLIRAYPNLQYYVVTDLEPSSTYEVQISALNDRGWSALDKFTTFTTMAATIGEVGPLLSAANYLLCGTALYLCTFLSTILQTYSTK